MIEDPGLQERGNIYNHRLMELMVKQAGRLPDHTNLQSIIHRELNEQAGTVAVTLDFRPEPDPCHTFPVAAIEP